ncbi:cupin [Rathayibacter sp. Leaf296]|nr:cupin [Rathayibacter sp. Leaf296]
MTLSPAAERPAAPGPAENFTGLVSVTPLSTPTDAIAASTAEVAFEPGARSAWHSHPAGQVLIVTDGGGWVQARGEERRALAPGDVVTTPAGIEHWHGAAAETPLTHIALTGVLDGVNAEWGDLVTDSEYMGAP